MGGKWPTDPTPHPTGDHLMKEVPTHIAPQVSFVSYRSLLSLIGLFVYVYIYVSYAIFFICVLCDFFFSYVSYANFFQIPSFFMCHFKNNYGEHGIQYGIC